jgi:hypothetical protein
MLTSFWTVQNAAEINEVQITLFEQFVFWYTNYNVRKCYDLFSLYFFFIIIYFIWWFIQKSRHATYISYLLTLVRMKDGLNRIDILQLRKSISWDDRGYQKNSESDEFKLLSTVDFARRCYILHVIGSWGFQEWKVLLYHIHFQQKMKSIYIIVVIFTIYV